MNRTDTDRLLLLDGLMDGIGDFHFQEDAAAIAAKHGREEPNRDDLLEAIRMALDFTFNQASTCSASK